MPTLHESTARTIAAIESEMRRIGLWQEEPLPPEAYDFRSAFGMDTMAFTQWLQFILIPRVRSIIEEGGSFPAESHVAAQAVRELDGHPDASALMSLLAEFDALFNT
jgi:uncharacterized protein YqcC (DUF446 family)